MPKFSFHPLICFFLLINSTFYSQSFSLDPEIKVTYNSKLKLGEKYTVDQVFILLGNSSSYYFAANQNFLNDMKLYKSSGVDLQAVSDNFQERIFKTESQYQVLFSYIDAKIRYSEKQSIKWVIYDEIKEIAGVKCQMAATNLYGRRWIAYFAKNGYDFSIGPYKFNGLPGLIFELYDTRNDYHFIVSKVEKYNKKVQFNFNAYKLYSKDKYLKAKFNLEYEGGGYPPMFGEMKKEYDETSLVLQKMYNNPIELN